MEMETFFRGNRLRLIYSVQAKGNPISLELEIHFVSDNFCDRHANDFNEVLVGNIRISWFFGEVFVCI